MRIRVIHPPRDATCRAWIGTGQRQRRGGRLSVFRQPHTRRIAALFAATAGLTVALYLLSFAESKVGCHPAVLQAAKRAARAEDAQADDEPWSLLMQLLHWRPAVGCSQAPDGVARIRWAGFTLLLIVTSAFGWPRLFLGYVRRRRSGNRLIGWRPPAVDTRHGGRSRSGGFAEGAVRSRSGQMRLRSALRPGSGALDLEQAFGFATQACGFRQGVRERSSMQAQGESATRALKQSLSPQTSACSR